MFHCLPDLLSSVSEKFKDNFIEKLDISTALHSFESLPVPVKEKYWISQHIQHSKNICRSEDSLIDGFASDQLYVVFFL